MVYILKYEEISCGGIGVGRVLNTSEKCFPSKKDAIDYACRLKGEKVRDELSETMKYTDWTFTFELRGLEIETPYY